MIYLPKFIDAGFSSRVGVKGEYRLVVRESDGTVARDTGWFDNIITNYGLNALGTSRPTSKLCLGTGTTAPAVTDTTLVAFVNDSDTTGVGGGYDPAFGVSNNVSPYGRSNTFSYRFNIGSLNGTFSEVGVSNTSDGTLLFSRALVVDAGGTPTTITVNSSQQLDAYYKLSRFPPLADTTNTFTIGGVSYTATGRAAFAGESTSWDAIEPFGQSRSFTLGANGSLGPITGQPTGWTATVSHDSNLALTAYVNNSLELHSSTSFTTAQGNVAGGINAVRVIWGSSSRGAAAFQYVLNGHIPKDANKTMMLNFMLNWARA